MVGGIADSGSLHTNEPKPEFLCGGDVLQAGSVGAHQGIRGTTTPTVHPGPRIPRNQGAAHRGAQILPRGEVAGLELSDEVATGTNHTFIFDFVNARCCQTASSALPSARLEKAYNESLSFEDDLATTESHTHIRGVD